MNNESQLNQAFAAYQARQFDLSEQLARAVLSQDPGHGDALYLLGLLAAQSGAFSLAEDLLYQAARLFPDIDAYGCALAMVLQKQGRWDEALEHYKRYQSQPAVLTQMGQIYLGKNQELYARECFDKALSADKNNPDALIGIAQMHIIHHRWRAAEKVLNRIALETPDKWYYLARVYRKTKRFRPAYRAIDTALQTPHPFYWVERGLIAWEDKKHANAIEAFQNAIQMNPYSAEAFYYLGRVYADGGRWDEAINAYGQALKCDAAHVEAHQHLAEALCRAGRLAEGLEHYRQAVVLNPRHVPTLFQLAVLLENMGEFEEAAGLYFNVLSLAPKHPKVSRRIARTLQELSRTHRKLAQKLAAGWVKNCPRDKNAQSIHKII